MAPMTHDVNGAVGELSRGARERDAGHRHDLYYLYTLNLLHCRQQGRSLREKRLDGC